MNSSTTAAPVVVKFTYNDTPTAWKDRDGWRGPVDQYLYYFQGTCQDTGEILHAYAGAGHYAGCPYLPVEDVYDYSITEDGGILCEDEYGQEVACEGWQDGPAPVPVGCNIQRWEKPWDGDEGEWREVGDIVNPQPTVYPAAA